jgi:flagellar FliL protein
MAKKKRADEAEDGRTPDEKGRRGRLMLAGGIAAALALAGGGGWLLFLKPKAAQTANADGKAGGQAPKKVAFLDLPEMTVNLSGGGERTQFLKMKIALEVAEQKTVTDITPLLPRVLDSFQVYMRELRPTDLEGSAGLYRLREEMTRRVNVAVYPAKVDAVLFKELMVQ